MTGMIHNFELKSVRAMYVEPGDIMELGGSERTVMFALTDEDTTEIGFTDGTKFSTGMLNTFDVTR